MERIKRILAACSAIVIVMTSIAARLTPTVFAQENTTSVTDHTQEMIEPEHDVNNENKSTSELGVNPATKRVGSRRIYVKTFAGAGDGSEGRPYDNFMTAYAAAQENDTIVILNDVPIQHDDNASDQGVFTFGKSLTIEGGNDGKGALNSRVPVQLGANVTMQNMEFSSKALYLNGHTLEMNHVKNNNNNISELTVYGGSFQNKPVNRGAKSILRTNSSVQDPFRIKAVYAGSASGVSNIPVLLDLQQGVKVLEKIDASGVTEKVAADVQFIIGSVNAGRFENTYNSPNASIIFNEYNNQSGTAVRGFSDVKLIDSQMQVKNADDFAGVNGKLELDATSILDISGLTRVFTVKDLVGAEGALIVVNRESGLIEVDGAFQGTVELRTPGADRATSGIVAMNHTYIKASPASSGRVVFKPYISQKNVELREEISNGTKNWVIRQKQASQFIHSLDLVGNKKIDIDVGEHHFQMQYADENGDALQYVPQFAAEIKDSTGNMVDYDKLEALYDEYADEMIVYINDNNIQTGKYTIVITEMMSGKVFEIPIELYKDNQQSSYTVTFNALGGKPQPASQNLQVGEKVQKPAPMQKKGYEFQFWSEADTGRVWNFDTDTVPAHGITLVANWKAASYKLTFDSKDGTAVSTQKVLFNQTVTEPQAPTKNGYTFDGWYKDASYQNRWNFQTDKMPAQDVTLYAKWTPKTYHVTFDSKGGTAVATQKVSFDQTVTEPQAPTKNGYTFGGWYKDASYQNRWNFQTNKMPAQDVTLYAKWTAKTYHVTFDSKGGTAVSTQKVSFDQMVTEPQVPTKSGYTFGGWYKDASYQNRWNFQTDKMPAQDITLYAKWTPKTYHVTFDSKGGTAVSTQKISFDQTVTEPQAPTKNGYTFDGWYKDASYQNRWNFQTDKMPAQNITLYAKWTPKTYHVTFDSKGGTTVSTQKVLFNQTVTEPQAPTKNGYTFGGWYKDASYQNRWNFQTDKMPAQDITLYAKWNSSGIPFRDVGRSDYYYDAVQWAVGKGITAGTSKDLFSPNLRCTRAQSVTMLWRLFDSKAIDQSHGFTDVVQTDYYEKAVRWAKVNHIVSGISKTEFGPNVVCTRAQIVMMLWRAAGSPVVRENVNFDDVKPNDYFAEAVKWAKVKGITAGVGDGKFAPHAPCTRAQIVSFMYKF